MAEHPIASINREWVRAAGSVQQTLGQLSAQLRRYVDEDYLREERTIYQLIRRIETAAVDLRADTSEKPVMTIQDMAPEIQLPMDRRLYAAPHATKLESPALQAGSGADGSLRAIFDQVVVDPERLQANLHALLAERPAVTLPEVLAVYPLEQGLPELLTYLVLASHEDGEAFDAEAVDRILFERDGRKWLAVCDRVVFRREDR